MAHWLIKSEPVKLVLATAGRRRAKGTFWNGVRNHSAKLHLMAMKVGEEAFFYHSNEGKEIVGIVDDHQALLSRPDRRERQVRHGRCRAGEGAETPVTLEAIKAEPQLEGHGARQ